MSSYPVQPVSTYPVQLDVRTPERIARWRPLVLWFLCIPQFIWAYILLLALSVVGIVGWFAALFTGRLPEGMGNFIMGVLRFQWRFGSYLYALSDKYPSFAVPTGYPDPVDDQALFQAPRSEQLSRVKVFFRGFMAIPQAIVLYFVAIAASAVLFVAWFAVLITGKWPAGMRNFTVGYFRWQLRYSAWYYMITDEYPPFSMQP